jgi:hypothetical protein
MIVVVFVLEDMEIEKGLEDFRGCGVELSTEHPGESADGIAVLGGIEAPKAMRSVDDVRC